MLNSPAHLHFLALAIEKSQESVDQGGFPAGAVVVKDGVVIGTGISIGNKLNDPTSHGELSAIRHACASIQSTDLHGATLYASMQPCMMCFSASMWSGIAEIYFAIPKQKVSDEYYGGHYHIEEVNQVLMTPLKINHLHELENTALVIVKKWEESLTV